MVKRLLGPDGEPIDLAMLKLEAAGPTLTAVRQVTPEHPSYGLSPEGLAGILRESEGHDPSRWWSLCEDVAEREMHYRAVLFQRRTALARLPIDVDPASDAAEHVAHADFIRSIVRNPDFTLSRFALSNAIHTGVSFGEIIWDTSEGQWMPASIKDRYLQWFRFDRVDLTTPLLVDETGQPQPLAPYKWLRHRAMLTPGIPARDGLGRAAVWAWMFKNFDLKAWMIFLDKYGQPLRLGRYPTGSTPQERATLLAALRNLGHDAAAIIPTGMNIEFIKAESGAGGGDAFQSLAKYFDEQLSKLTVGQTATTDKDGGSYALGKVHEGVLEGIACFDGLVLATTFNRDLVRPVIDLNFGKQKLYPTITIGVGERKNAELILENLWEAVDRGLDVEASQIYPLLNLTEPAKKEGVVLLRPLSRAMPGEEPGGPPVPPKGDRADPPGGTRRPTREESAAAEDDPPPRDSFDQATDAIIAGLGWVPEVDGLGDALAACTTVEEMEAVLAAHLDKLGTAKVAEILARARFAARLAGETSGPNG